MNKIKKMQLILCVLSVALFVSWLIFSSSLQKTETVNEETIELPLLTISSKSDNQCGCNAGLIVNKYYLKLSFRFTPKIEAEKGIHYSININLSNVDCTVIYAFQKYEFDEVYSDELKEIIKVDNGYDKSKVHVIVYNKETMETKSLGINAYKKYDHNIDRDKTVFYNEKTGEEDKLITIADALKMSESGVLRKREVKFEDLSNAEKKFVVERAQKEIILKMKFFSSGLIVKPEEFQTAAIARDSTWSVMPSSPGIYPATLQVYGLDSESSKDNTILIEEKLFNIEVFPSSKIKNKEILQNCLGIITCVCACLAILIQFFKKNRIQE